MPIAPNTGWAGAQQVYSHFNAIFYLGTVRYMNEALDHAHDGDNDGALTAINQAASGLLLTQDDLVTSFE